MISESESGSRRLQRANLAQRPGYIILSLVSNHHHHHNHREPVSNSFSHLKIHFQSYLLIIGLNAVQTNHRCSAGTELGCWQECSGRSGHV